MSTPVEKALTDARAALEQWRDAANRVLRHGSYRQRQEIYEILEEMEMECGGLNARLEKRATRDFDRAYADKLIRESGEGES